MYWDGAYVQCELDCVAGYCVGEMELQHGGCTQGWVAGEWEFFLRGEDAHANAFGLLHFGGAALYEGGFGKVEMCIRDRFRIFRD